MRTPRVVEVLLGLCGDARVLGAAVAVADGRRRRGCAAVFTPAPRSDRSALVASTSRMLQVGQMALTMSRSSEISPPQSAVGRGVVARLPVWLTLWKQPFAVVQGGRPNCAR